MAYNIYYIDNCLIINALQCTMYILLLLSRYYKYLRFTNKHILKHTYIIV